MTAAVFSSAAAIRYPMPEHCPLHCMVENVLSSTFSDRYFGRCLHWRILCDDGRVHYTHAVGSRLRELRELAGIIKNICEKCYISLQAGFRLEFCLLFLWQCAIIRTESKWYFGVSYRDSRNQMERWAYTC